MSIQEGILKKVDFVTLSRSDYASIRPVIQHSLESQSFLTGVIAGGSHFLKRFGSTINVVKKEFQIHDTVHFLTEEDDDAHSLSVAYSRAVNEFVRVLKERQPDILFLLGDRWELMAAATAATMLRIPIAHHSGGDITQGSADNQVRYAISILSHLHFVSLKEHADRLIKMGEEPWRIHITGEPALSQLNQFKKKISGLYEHLGLASNESFILATFHPTSYDGISVEEQITIYVEALSTIRLPVILTAPNPDEGSGIFLKELINHASKTENIKLIKNLGNDYYYAAMAAAKLMVGNSSSGLWEAPSFALPVVNIGRRQEGRFRCENVIDADLNLASITKAIHMALNPAFKQRLTNENPYAREKTNEMIINSLSNAPSRDRLLAKRLIDPLQL